MAIDYQEQVWVDGTDTYTPLTADRMNHMEAGIKAACDGWDSVSHKVNSLFQDITSEFIVQPGWSVYPNQFAAVRIGDLVVVSCCFYRAGAQWSAPAWSSNPILKFPTNLSPGGSFYDRNVPITMSTGNDDFCVGVTAAGTLSVRTVDHSSNFANTWSSSFVIAWIVGK